MRKQIKIQACSSPSIEDAFKDFLLHKKATGIAEKTLRSYSQQFSAVSKFIDSSVPIDQLVKRQLEEMFAIDYALLEQQCSNQNDQLGEKREYQYDRLVSLGLLSRESIATGSTDGGNSIFPVVSTGTWRPLLGRV